MFLEADNSVIKVLMLLLYFPSGFYLFAAAEAFCQDSAMWGIRDPCLSVCFHSQAGNFLLLIWSLSDQKLSKNGR